jgi:hypothetical protein
MESRLQLASVPLEGANGIDGDPVT